MAALLAGMLPLQAAVAEQQGAVTKVTGMVTEVDEDTNEITIDDQTFVMPEESGGASLMPQVGAEVTLYYEEEDGEKTITRIGQAEQ
jgi:Protein of unknown function (DUF1344)